ncbi:MAG: class I SAM-dependent methyltransferase [Rhodospirillaceae bacterium]|nr:class I SAM-dependent methyltransferase [Rhodospirillaceae bacterium]
MDIRAPRQTERYRLSLLVLAITLPGVLLGQGEANRDIHGPADVDSYIENLLDARRVEELKPDEVVAALMLAENAVVADLGSGPGVFTIPLARQVTRGVVYAVDVEPRQLAALRSRVTDAELNNIVPVLASHSTPHLPPASLDLILVVDTYHHLEDRVNYFRRLRSMLRAGGRLAILEYRAGELPVGPPAARKLPEGVREQELRAAGYGLLGTFEMHEYHDFEVWVPSTSF